MKTSSIVNRFGCLAMIFAFTFIICSMEAQAKSHFVSLSGNNQSGDNWKEAWNELDQIDWQVIKPGDRILVDGGTYHTQLAVSKSGEKKKPISITQSRARGHNGLVKISGDGSSASTGVVISGSHIRIRGNKRCGIKVCDFSSTGLIIGNTTSSVILNNLEIANNGVAGNWFDSKGGLVVQGGGHRIYNLNVHDNQTRNIMRFREDQTSTPCLFSLCWVYNENDYHSDGLDFRSDNAPGGGINATGADRIVYCAVGPGLDHGIRAIGDAGGVTIIESLLLSNKLNNVYVSSRVSSTKIKIRNVTSFSTRLDSPGDMGRCEMFYGVPGCYTITDGGFNSFNNIYSNGLANWKVLKSIFYGGQIRFPAQGTVKAKNNFQFNVTGNTTVVAPELVDPQFQTDVSSIPVDISFADLSRTVFNLSKQSPALGAGARYITRASRLGCTKN